MIKGKIYAKDFLKEILELAAERNNGIHRPIEYKYSAENIRKAVDLNKNLIYNANTEKLYHGRELISYPSNPKDITVYEDHELEWLLKDQFVPHILNTAYKLENGYEIY